MISLSRDLRHSQAPVKTLEAPSIQDDFYLNLVDWSSQNVVAVALGSRCDSPPSSQINALAVSTCGTL